MAQLSAFLSDTQPEIAAAVSLSSDTAQRGQFLNRLRQEINSRGVVDVLRRGVKHRQHGIALYYACPTPGNEAAAEHYGRNRFTGTRQLRYSNDRGQQALDLGLFVNGLPVVTAELKNSLPRQTAAGVAEQYWNHRNPREPLFRLGRCLAHFARDGRAVFDSVIVATDRVALDRQINATIRQFTQVSATVGHAENAGDLRRFISEGRRIIITTAQKFPFVLDEIDIEPQGRNYAIIIDEAHSGQGGRTSSAMSQALAGGGDDNNDDDTFEDQINRIITRRRLLPNASYFAFTATPKNRTLELFGDALPQPDGAVKHRPFHSYTMKQALQEGFILDMLGSYTPVTSYYNLVKKISGDPEFDAKRAQSKLRRFVENHRYSISQKADIMVAHLHDAIIAPRKINGEARAMVVTDGVERAIKYYHAVSECLAGRNSPYRAIVAFSGEREHGGRMVSEASLNGFLSSQIEERIRQDPYRILICADKFQTGYDEPLLHTMYVDKTLSGIKAVQTLSCLNRARAGKYDVFVLDFMNDAEVIRYAFADYYRTTLLADETGPDKLHDLKARLDGRGIYTSRQVEELVASYLGGVGRDTLDPVLDNCVAAYLAELDEDGQVDFKGSAKAFTRLYNFLAQVLPYAQPEWEKLAIFLNFLIPKLPAPVEDDLSRGILETVDMDSYRAEKQATVSISMPDDDAEIDPILADGGFVKPEPELDTLSRILSDFNNIWGTLFTDADRVGNLIANFPMQVEADTAYRNARRNSARENAHVEHDAALRRAIINSLQCSTELYKHYTENADFKRWLHTQIFAATDAAVAKQCESQA